jgi:hypothetical protein
LALLKSAEERRIEWSFFRSLFANCKIEIVIVGLLADIAPAFAALTLARGMIEHELPWALAVMQADMLVRCHRHTAGRGQPR